MEHGDRGADGGRSDGDPTARPVGTRHHAAQLHVDPQGQAGDLRAPRRLRREPPPRPPPGGDHLDPRERVRLRDLDHPGAAQPAQLRRARRHVAPPPVQRRGARAVAEGVLPRAPRAAAGRTSRSSSTARRSATASSGSWAATSAGPASSTTTPRRSPSPSASPAASSTRSPATSSCSATEAALSAVGAASPPRLRGLRRYRRVALRAHGGRTTACSSAAWAVTSARASPRCSRTNRGSASSSASTSTRRGGGCTGPTFHLVSPDRSRPHRRHDHRVQPARRRAHLGLGAAQPGEPGDGPPAHRRRGDVDPRRGRRVPGPGVGHRAQRHRDLRPGPRRADPTRRVRRHRPDVRLRRDARRHRAHGRGDRPARRRHRRRDPHGHRARTARAEPARPGAADAGRARSACSPIRRSPSSRTSRWPGRSSPPPNGASPSR